MRGTADGSEGFSPLGGFSAKGTLEVNEAEAGGGPGVLRRASLLGKSMSGVLDDLRGFA
jgi:hypothetical protein